VRVVVVAVVVAVAVATAATAARFIKGRELLLLFGDKFIVDKSFKINLHVILDRTFTER
jgi:hypothetical protein